MSVLAHNWKAKLGCLLLSVVIWYTIKEHLKEQHFYKDFDINQLLKGSPLTSTYPLDGKIRTLESSTIDIPSPSTTETPASSPINTPVPAIAHKAVYPGAE